MSMRASRAQLEAERASIDSAIAAHPMAADSVVEANAVIEAIGRGNREQVAAELSERGLPSLEELGRIHLTGTASWWRLHRNRRAIEKKLARLPDR